MASEEEVQAKGVRRLAQDADDEDVRLGVVRDSMRTNPLLARVSPRGKRARGKGKEGEGGVEEGEDKVACVCVCVRVCVCVCVSLIELVAYV